MQPDVTGFLDRFTAFGASPSVETYLPLFHPDATLFDSGMERPITFAEIPASIEATLALVPDFEMVPERWRERDGTLFVEARNRATVAGMAARWSAVYCVDLAGDRVIRGRRYYDRRPLFGLLNPDLPSLPGPAPDTEAHIPRLEERGADALAMAHAAARTPCHAPLASLLPDLELEVVQWAGDATLCFVEWTATVAGSPLRFGIADRIERAEGRPVSGRSYFDSLELATRLAAVVSESGSAAA